MFNEGIFRSEGLRSEAAIGPSMLESMAKDDAWWDSPYRFVVPEELLQLARLIREGSDEHRDFMVGLIRYFRRSPWPSSRWNEPDDVTVASQIAELILRLEDRRRLLLLGDEVAEPEVAEALANLYPESRFEVAMSPRRRFLRDYLVKIYSWSKVTGGVVIERTRRVFNDLGRHIATLQLPDTMDEVVRLKGQHLNRFFGFRGGRAVRYFVGLAVGVGGLFNPIASGVGVLIVFADP